MLANVRSRVFHGKAIPIPGRVESYSPCNGASKWIPLRITAKSSSSFRASEWCWRRGFLIFRKRKESVSSFAKMIVVTWWRGDTPFQRACENHGIENTIEVIENVLADCSDNQYDTAYTLISAATDADIYFDGVYFLLRWEPDALCTNYRRVPKTAMTRTKPVVLIIHAS